MRLSLSAPRRPRPVPVARRDLVRRTALLDRLSRTVAQPLVVLVAPPGYGKTSVLLQWVEHDPRETVWLTVDDGDNDPTRLFGHIAAALDPSADPARPRDRPEPGLRHLIDRIAARRAPVVVVLDDVHRLHTAPVPDQLVELAAALPTGSQLVVASRSTPPLRLARLRVEGRCAEFGAGDLAFDTEEAGRALALAGADLGDGDLRLLVERTEGWPAGVYLAALALRYRVDLCGAPGHVTGDDANIADFFRDELLARLPADTVRFLLRTAVLDRLTAPLCDAVLAATDSAARLADVARRNLFVVPLDHHRQWYRYHRLFSEALVAELRRREPGEEERIHLRAAEWYERQELVEEAIAHRIAGGDRVNAARLVDEHGTDYIGFGRIATVRRWVQALGWDTVLAHPSAAVTAAWTAAFSGETERAQYLLLVAERASYPGPLPNGHASLDAATALLRAMIGIQGVDRMLADARRALALEPPGSRWNALAATVLGVALLLDGDPDAAIAQFEYVAELGREQPRVEAALAAAQLSLLAADRDEAAGAMRWAVEGRRNLDVARNDDRVTTVLMFVAGARADLMGGARESARRGLDAAVRHYTRVPPAAFPWLAAQAALALGELSLALGDPDAARARLGEARRHLARLPTSGVRRGAADSLDAAVARTGDPATVPVAVNAGATALSAAEERVLLLLPTHLSLGEIGAELYVSRNTVKTQVGAIYRKLQATSRAGAVAQARALGLLPD